MARHRKIAVRMWGDEKFRRLTPSQPCGQTLWIYLLTGPHTTSIPGLFSIGELALAEALGWSLKAFRVAFREAFLEGMAEADWKARVVWVPKAIDYNPPESPNVVKGWMAYWDDIPECPLKVKAHIRFTETLASIGHGFSAAFKPFWKALPKTMPNQEQEQEQDNTPLPPKGGESGFEKFWERYPRKHAERDARRAWNRLRPDERVQAAIMAGLEKQCHSAEWSREGGRYVPKAADWLRGHRWTDQPLTTNRAGPTSAEIDADMAARRAESAARKAALKDEAEGS